MATEKSFGHLWLSEGFATYFTILYFENKYGRDTIVNMLKQNREDVIEYSKKSDKPVVDLLQTDFMKLLNANSYQKGGWVLHMIRQELGDSVFWKSIRKYYEIYAGGIAGTEDLQKVFEDISGKNLKQFFTQWLYTPGQPELKLNWEYNKTSKTLKATVQQMQKKLFEFPLEIKIIYGDGKFLYKQINISGQSTSFSLSANQKPTTLILDPDVQLLFEESNKK
jgi:aminopeptidase N